MLKRKKTLSKLLATTMVLTSFTVNASAAEVNTSTIGGNDRYETAIKISENGWSSSDRAVLINGEKGLVDALTATPYAYAKNAPILITAQGKLTTSTKNRLSAMNVKNVDIVGGVNSVSNQVVTELKNMGITVNRISGASRYDTSLAVAKEVDKIQDVSEIAVVNGDKGIPDAVSVAAPAASKKMPILLAENGGLNSASKDFVNGESVSKSYVIGSNNSVSDSVLNSLPGTKTRLGGADRHDTNAAVIKEFYTATSLSNVYVAKSGRVKTNDEIVDALSAGVLAAKNGNPIVLVGNSLNSSQQTLLAGKKFTKLTQIGMGVPANAVNQIKNTQAEAEASVSSVSVVNGVTLKLSGKDLNLIDKTKVEIANNTVKSYTTSASEATVVFDKEFNNGTNTLKVTSNLGKVTEHNFTYKSSLADINSVKGFTKEVGKGTLATLEVAVNGNNFATKVRDLKKQGWKVEFKSNSNIFYSGSTEGTKTSTDGRLKNLTDGSSYEYEVKITKGDNSYSDVAAFKVVDKANVFKEIKSNKLIVNTSNGSVVSNNNQLALNETAIIDDIKVVNLQGNIINANISDFKVESSNKDIITVLGDNSLQNNGKTGNATITLSSGSNKLSFNISVVNKKRELSTASIISGKTTKIMTDVEGDIRVNLKDTLGDPYTGNLFEADKVLKDSDNKEIAKIKNNVSSDEYGNATITVTGIYSGDGTGTATLPIKNETVTVKVVKNTNPTSWKLEVVDGNKTDLDLYTPNKNNLEKSVELKLVGSNEDGFSSGEIKDANIEYTSTKPAYLESKNYAIYSTNDEVANVDVDNGKLTLTANKKAGNDVYIKIAKGNSENKPVDSLSTIKVNVSDNRPKATDIELGYIDKITTVSKIDVVQSLFDIRSDEVNCLKIDGVAEKVLYTVDADKNPVFYIDKDATGGYNSEKDILLATVKVSNTFNGESDEANNGIIDIPLVSKGEIVVSVYLNGSNESKVVERIAVDVQ